MAGLCGAAWNRLRALGVTAWRRRTKVVGSIGIAAGAAERWLTAHPTFKLPARGSLLMLFGGCVFLVGLYNELVLFLEQRGDAPPQ